ncbi:MAG: hypothetical protein OXG72_09345 [Acidobacteria bacterium]|nr:hypothetical protein [Acidobacteriota bacterium]
MSVQVVIRILSSKPIQVGQPRSHLTNIQLARDHIANQSRSVLAQ